MFKTFLYTGAAAALLAITACSDTSGAAESQKPVAKATQAVNSYDALAVPSGTYTMDKTHGYVTFIYLHKGLSNPVLRFDDVDATLVLDADKPENSQIDVTITAENIDSGVAKFDAHLKSPDFFDTAKNPTITFKSTSFTRASATTGTMTGDLTMMGTTKPVTFDVSLVGTDDGKKPAIGVEGTTKILRSDFALGKYVPRVGDAVTISVSAEFYKDVK